MNILQADDPRVPEIIVALAQARREGWYTEDPAWEYIDSRLRSLGFVVEGW